MTKKEPTKEQDIRDIFHEHLYDGFDINCNLVAILSDEDALVKAIEAQVLKAHDDGYAQGVKDAEDKQKVKDKRIWELIETYGDACQDAGSSAIKRVVLNNKGFGVVEFERFEARFSSEYRKEIRDARRSSLSKLKKLLNVGER